MMQIMKKILVCATSVQRSSKEPGPRRAFRWDG